MKKRWIALFCLIILPIINAQIDSRNPACYKLYIAGDVNDDGVLDITDPINILQYLFNGQSLACPSNANVNGDARVDLSDAIFLLNYMFNGQNTPDDQPREVDLPPFLALTPAQDSKVTLAFSEPMIVQLFDANFFDANFDDDVLYCTGVAYDGQGGQYLLFDMGGSEPLGQPFLRPYSFVLSPTDLKQGNYNVEITCKDQAGNIGIDKTDLTIGREEPDVTGDNPCRENIDACCSTQFPVYPYKKYVCMRDCDYDKEKGINGEYVPTCFNLKDVVAGGKITEKGDWLPSGKTSDCNAPYLGERADSIEEVTNPLCKKALGLSYTPAKNEFIQLQSPGPGGTSPPSSGQCVVKYATILSSAVPDPKNPGKKTVGNDKITLPGSVLEGVGVDFVNPVASSSEGLPGIGAVKGENYEFDGIKQPFRGHIKAGYGFFFVATYAAVDSNGKELEGTPDTKLCREYQFVEGEEEIDKGSVKERKAVFIFPFKTNEVLYDKSQQGLIELDQQQKLANQEQIIEVIKAGKGSSPTDLRCRYQRPSDALDICSDDYYQSEYSSKYIENREWTDTNFDSIAQKIVPIVLKKHNFMLDKIKAMYWYDLPDLGYSSLRQKSTGTKKGAFVMKVEDESGLHGIECVLDGLVITLSYDPSTKKHTEEVTPPSFCRCAEYTRPQLGAAWQQEQVPGKFWDC